MTKFECINYNGESSLDYRNPRVLRALAVWYLVVPMAVRGRHRQVKVMRVELLRVNVGKYLAWLAAGFRQWFTGS